MYEAPRTEGPLRQGEILGPISNHAVAYPPVEIPWGQTVRVRSVTHELVVVLTPDCDLEWDYDMRFVTFLNDGDPVQTVEHPQAVSRVLLCHLQSRGEFRPRFQGKREIYRRIEQNQDERYHSLPPARVQQLEAPTYLHKLFLDFKKVTSVVTGDLYDGVFKGQVERVALLPPEHLHDVMQRFAAFLSRVALEEPV